jgi:short-subunit dehydrogenase
MEKNDSLVIVTGGARGLGALFCRALVSRGYHVLAIDYYPQPWSDLSNQLLAGRIHCLELDLLNGDALTIIEEKVTSLGLSLVGLVNNAALMVGGAFEEVQWAQHEAMVRVNLEVPLKLTHALLPKLKRSENAFIINMCSVTSMAGIPFGLTYATSKWGMLGFSESLRNEFRTRGIRNIHVLAVCPSTIETGLFAGTKPPILIPMLQPQTVVDAAMRGLDRRVQVVMLPFFVRFIPLMRGLLPLRVFDYVARILGVHDALKTWRGRSKVN